MGYAKRISEPFGRSGHCPSARRKSGQRRDRKHRSIGPSSIKENKQIKWIAYGNGPQLIKGPLGTNGLKEEQREQLEINYREDWTTDEQREQLENNHRGDSTTDTSRRNGLLHSVRPFGTNGLKEGAM
jgi:hypothetical protein